MKEEFYKILSASALCMLFVLYLVANNRINTLEDELRTAKTLVVTQHRELIDINHELATSLEELNRYIELNRLMEDLGK